MISTISHHRFHFRMTLILAVGMGLSAPSRSFAAALTSSIKLDADDLNRPMVLDQNGKALALPSKQHHGPLILASGVTPNYVAYRVDSDDSLPKGIPTVDTGSTKAGQTTSPLHLDTMVKARLDQELAQNSMVAVHTQSHTYLVTPLAPLFGSASDTTDTTTKLWLAAQASSANGASKKATQTPSPAQSQPQAQTLIPSSITDSQLMKDLKSLFTLKSGKLVNLNLTNIDNLKHDLNLNLGPPKNVASHPAVRQPSGTAAAETLVPPSSIGGTPQPAPIPEPSTLCFLGLAVAAVTLRRQLSGRRPGQRTWADQSRRYLSS
jgi:hypothetical protein